MNILERAEKHLAQLAPEIRARESAVCLALLIDEVKLLQKQKHARDVLLEKFRRIRNPPIKGNLEFVEKLMLRIDELEHKLAGKEWHSPDA